MHFILKKMYLGTLLQSPWYKLLHQVYITFLNLIKNLDFNSFTIIIYCFTKHYERFTPPPTQKEHYLHLLKEADCVSESRFGTKQT